MNSLLLVQPQVVRDKLVFGEWLGKIDATSLELRLDGLAG